METKHINSNGPFSDHSNTDVTYNIFLNSGQHETEVKNWKEKLEKIIQNLPEEDSLLQPLIQFLVTTIQPAKIYKIEYPSALESESPFTDLLLVIPCSDSRTFKEIEAILEIPYLPSKTIRCTLYKEDLVLDRLKQGHIYFSGHCIPENLLYDDGKQKYPITSPELWETIKGQAGNAYIQANHKAFDFFKSAAKLLDPTQERLPDIVIFFLHQAVELCYRNILQFESGYSIKTHKIRLLRAEVSQFAPQLAAVFNEESDEDTRLMNLMENGYLQARYALTDPLSKEDILNLSKKINFLLKGATKHVARQLRARQQDAEVKQDQD